MRLDTKSYRVHEMIIVDCNTFVEGQILGWVKINGEDKLVSAPVESCEPFYPVKESEAILASQDHKE